MNEQFEEVLKDENDDNVTVTRGELKEILGQITDNMNEMTHYLMEDINTLFKNHVYPAKLVLQAITELLEEREYICKADIDERSDLIHKKAVEQAKERIGSQEETQS